ncbi:heme ABC exporter ATP-binding protein CcmA [Halobacillus salinus]|uniref:Carnitine transport ATP-binding protein OpuCA n=1 Tax=Halobacillus salinus TaxID=192814 RepID=A0A4Z0GVU1_9BACI|nr:heme ABC exporter ATP-binding protein CcmA [Halobacillus salinus]TGB01865.1 heme ABC exporter ATP-binding protein CcmA [Halobacillus salinus]
MTNTLEIKQLSKQFQRNNILNDISFSLHKGEVLSIVGPSGSGKTTLLRILAGLEPPTGGSIVLSGKDITSQKANKRNISLVFQQPLLFPHMTVKENIEYGAKLVKKADKRKIHSLLEAIDLLEYQDYYPAEISGGQQQRVALARAMATEPAVILFDEPFSSLDPKLRKELRLWVRSFLEDRSITSIFVTHDTEEAMLMGDRIALFHDGRFQQIDESSTLYQTPANPFVANFLGGHIVLDEARYIPLRFCRLELPSDESFEKIEGMIKHRTFQHGQMIGHIHIHSLNQNISMPLSESNTQESVSLYLPGSEIRSFGGDAT